MQCLRTVSVDMSLNYLRLCHAQTCGKCVPCRIGLGQLEVLIEQVLDRTATMETINIIGAYRKGDCRFRRLCDWL